MKAKTIIAWAAAFGALAVILGALGAHALKARLEPESLKSFETAVRYQAWHALALLIIGLSTYPIKQIKAIVVFWIIGVFLFSGSIYLLSTSAITNFDLRFFGPVTPIGGLFLIAGWLLLFTSAIRSKGTDR